MRARVVYDAVAARFVGEVVTKDGTLVAAFVRNSWDAAMDAAKDYCARVA